jgi:serine/threonine protein kinase
MLLHCRFHPVFAAAGAVEAEDCTGAQLGWNIGFSNKFSLGQVLGRGSFGTVHVAFHKLTGSSYAVKVLRKCGKHGMQLEAIEREVATWQQAQGSRYVARIEGLYEVSLVGLALHLWCHGILDSAVWGRLVLHCWC